MSDRFPVDYPEKLKKISWVAGEICGPNPYWHRHLAYDTRGCGLFVKDILLDIFYKQGCPVEVCKNFVDFLCKAFTVYFSDEAGEFRITTTKKLNPKTGKKENVMTNDDFKKAYLDIEYTVKDGNKLTKYVLTELVKTYNNLIKK